MLENLELIYISKKKSSIDQNSIDDMNIESKASKNNLELSNPFLAKNIRNIIAEVVTLLIKQKSITDEDVLLNLLKVSKKTSSDIDQNTKLIDKERKIVRSVIYLLSELGLCQQNTSKTKLTNGKNWNIYNWFFTPDRWDQYYSESYSDLKKRFLENLEKIKKSDLYFCSKKCNNNLYDFNWTCDNNNLCENGHNLEPLSQEIKNKFISDITYDLRILDSIPYPKKIIYDVQKVRKVEDIEIPLAQLFQIPCILIPHIVSMHYYMKNIVIALWR